VADLSTDIGGLRLRNPVIAASCEYTMTEDGILACIDAGAGAVIAKSINESPAAAKQLDIADYALLDPDLRAVPWASATGNETLFNRSGLAQTTVEDWVEMLKRCQQHAATKGSAVIGSVTVASAEGAAELAAIMATAAPPVEINIGAPHGREASAVHQITEAEGVARYTRMVRAAVDCPLIIKLPGQAGDIVGMAQAATDNGANAVSMIGRFNGFVPNVDTWEPELGSWAAVGGNWALPISLYWISKCFNAMSTPLIGTNGARTGLDTVRFLLSGARGVEFASLLLMRGAPALTDVITELDTYLDRRGITNLDEIIGASARRAKSYHEIDPIVPPVRPWLDR
jgi:dihydroorotate dehydrogenase